jgi:predicted GIY-YIG superfamily endonuclease
MSHQILMCEVFPFSVLPISGWSWCTGSQVYMFVRREWSGSRSILYIGETENLAERIRCHEKWDRAIGLGMNELHIHSLAKTKAERLRVETWLRNRYPTPLNDQGSPCIGLGSMGAGPMPYRTALHGLNLSAASYLTQ